MLHDIQSNNAMAKTSNSNLKVVQQNEPRIVLHKIADTKGQSIRKKKVNK